MGIIQRFTGAYNSLFGNQQEGINKFNEAFFRLIGAGGATYDAKMKSYIEQGYNINPIVYSVIMQMAQKSASVPLYVKEIEDEGSYKALERLRLATKGGMNARQRVKEANLIQKAFKEGEYSFPLREPNPVQTWTEFFQLVKVFLRCTGNVYIYRLKGEFTNEVQAYYILPSHLMEIVLKPGASMIGVDTPIRGYLLQEGVRGVEFDESEVIHIKYPNPNYDTSGSHLYGFSPLRAGLKNIESSNEGLNLNIGTLKSGGAFGFIHAKNTPLTAEQAQEIKARLVEMKKDPGDLARIAGTSADMGFTRISLTSDELKPFDYLKWDQKTICNVLGWSDSLLNNDDGGKYDKQLQERKRVVTDNIVPDLDLILKAFNDEIIEHHKGFEQKVIEYDIMELPEMQDDATLLSEWLYQGLDRGVFTRNEVRKALRWEEGEEEGLDRLTVMGDILTLEEAIETPMLGDGQPTEITPENNETDDDDIERELQEEI